MATYQESLQVHSLTLTRFLLSEQRKIPHATGQFSELMYSLQTAIKNISGVINRIGVSKDWVKSDKRAEADLLVQRAHDYVINVLSTSFTTCMIVSSMVREPILVDPEFQGKYIVCIDPIDAPDNVGSFGPVGTIFSIFRHVGKEINPLRSGNEIMAAGYAIYSGSTMFVMNMGIGLGLNGFTLNPDAGEFVLTNPQMEIPKWGRLYSIDEGHSGSWDNTTTEYIRNLKDPKAPKFYNYRFTGSTATDVHRVIRYGGIYLRPSTRDDPGGSMGLLYGAIPLAAMVVEAGGLATSGYGPIADITPESQHHATTVYMGSRQNVTSLLEMVAIANASQ